MINSVTVCWIKRPDELVSAAAHVCFSLQPQVLHSSHQGDQEPLMQQAPPPPGNPTQPETPADRLRPSSTTPDCTSQRAGADGKSQRKVEEEETNERRSSSRSLRPPQPSKLRLFLSQACGSAPGSSNTQPLAPRQPDGGKLEAFSCGSSRLPKPKSH